MDTSALLLRRRALELCLKSKPMLLRWRFIVVLTTGLVKASATLTAVITASTVASFASTLFNTHSHLTWTCFCRPNPLRWAKARAAEESEKTSTLSCTAPLTSVPAAIPKSASNDFINVESHFADLKRVGRYLHSHRCLVNVYHRQTWPGKGMRR
eukprot:6490826-Amphidinium_carterae.2